MRRFDVLIVGAGHGGAQVAIELRQKGFQGSIGVIGDEPDLPYERPTLSKEYLSGERDFDRILIQPVNFWKENGITTILGHPATQVDAASKIVALKTEETFGYGSLVWTTGGRPRLLPCDGIELKGIHVIRTRSDVDQIVVELARVEDIAIIGGGYVGLEAAAVLTKLGKKVTVLEALDRVLARVSGEPLSRFYEAEHRSRGVKIVLNAQVASIIGQNQHISGICLETGEIIAAQMAIIGIGIIPSVEPLTAAGAEGKNGVAVDAFCRTSLPDVYSIGDCALHVNPFGGNVPLRLESIQNVTDQAKTAAKTIIGIPEPYRSVPWFWSNQYDLRLQTVGISAGHDDFVIRGAPEARSFSVVYLKNGRVIALDCVNATRDYVQGRKLVAEGTHSDKKWLKDTTIPLKEIAT